MKPLPEDDGAGRGDTRRPQGAGSRRECGDRGGLRGRRPPGARRRGNPGADAEDCRDGKHSGAGERRHHGWSRDGGGAGAWRGWRGTGHAVHRRRRSASPTRTTKRRWSTPPRPIRVIIERTHGTARACLARGHWSSASWPSKTDLTRRGASREEAFAGAILPYIRGEINKLAAIDGRLDEGFIWAGEGVGLITDIPTARELIERMARDTASAAARIHSALG